MKILYDNENIYVAFIAHDNEPDRIDRQMGRRDQFKGDVVGINFDSYFDHRTGFEFNLTAAGVKIDLMLTNEDLISIGMQYGTGRWLSRIPPGQPK